MHTYKLKSAQVSPFEIHTMRFDLSVVEAQCTRRIFLLISKCTADGDGREGIHYNNKKKTENNKTNKDRENDNIFHQLYIFLLGNNPIVKITKPRRKERSF